MVDPRIYRALLAPVAFAVIVFAFSLQSQPHGARSTIPTGQYFASVAGTARQLTSAYPDRAPGSAGDMRLAAAIRAHMAGPQGFSVRTATFGVGTAHGSRTLENVIATRPGLDPGEIVVVSDRDAHTLAGTAVMLDLESALAAESLGRAVTLISTTGEIGAAGASEVARELTGQPVDAVILLGDLTATRVRQPVVVPWSSTDRLAPLALRNTVALALRSAAGLGSAGAGLGGQLAQLAFPFSVTAQAPFAGAGIPAVAVSLSGDRLSGGGSQAGVAGAAGTSRVRLPALGAAVLQAVDALDRGAPIPAPSSYLVLSGKVVPVWAVRLLVLILILPVAATAIDALARTRRRGHSTMRWVVWVLAGAVPFLLGLLAALVARASGLVHAILPGAVGAGAVPLGGGGTAALIGVVVVILLGLVVGRPLCLRLAGRLTAADRRPQTPAADAAAVALTVVLCVTAILIWDVNPYSAALLVPALHLWLWLAAGGVRTRRWAVLLLAAVAVLPAVAVVVYYGLTLGLSPLGLAWSGLLMVLGGVLSPLAAVYWCVALGCLTSVIVIGVRAVRGGATAVEPAVTVRGPVTYAGPGSLGGTESALRR